MVMNNINLYRWSKYANVFKNNRVVAVFNSLRLHPLYLDQELFRSIEPHLSNGVSEHSSIWQEHYSIFEHLRENKAIIHCSDHDCRALQRARDSCPEPFPHVLYLLITNDCNMRCTYCFVRSASNSDFRRINMSEYTAKNVLDFFKSAVKRGSSDDFKAEKHIIFYGGEPLLNLPVLQFAIQYSRKLISDGELPEKTRLSIVTNGTLLSKETVEILKGSEVNVGISLDGDRTITDQTRPLKSGKSAFDTIVNAVSISQDAGIDVSLSVTVTPLGLARKEALLQQILKLKVKSISFNMLIGKNTSLPDSYNSDVSQFLLDAFDLLRSKGIYEDRMMRKTRSFVEGTLYRFDCAASGGNQIVAASDGSLGICHGFVSTREFFYGNVNTGIDKSTYKKVYNEWNHRSPVFMDECEECPAIAICGGGCPYNAFINTGSIWGKDERFCIHATAALNWLIWDLYKNIIERNPSNQKLDTL